MWATVLLLVVLILQNDRSDACLPRREKHLTDSYVPVGIQAVHHYKTQLQKYYPYAFTGLCHTGYSNATVLPFHKKLLLRITGDVFKGKQDASISPFLCVAESVARLNIFLIDLQKEAVKQSLYDYQGFTRSVVMKMEETSGMTSAQQFRFILQKLKKEGTGSRVTCKIKEFLKDLENPNSDLSRNFVNVKPLNYLS